MKRAWSRVTSLASACWMGLLVLGGIGVAVNWNLFTVAGGVLVIFGVGLGVIFLPGLMRQWHAKTTQVIEREAKELTDKLTPPHADSSP